MRLAALTLIMASLAAAGSASAASRVSDVEYIRAARCRGLATGLGVDASALDAFVKAEGRSRLSYITMRADEEEARAKRLARDPARAPQLTAELNGPCQAYK